MRFQEQCEKVSWKRLSARGLGEGLEISNETFETIILFSDTEDF